MFKNRNQRRKRNPHSYAKGLISLYYENFYDRGTLIGAGRIGTESGLGGRPDLQHLDDFQFR